MVEEEYRRGRGRGAWGDKEEEDGGIGEEEDRE